jgi:hypothetical protein
MPITLVRLESSLMPNDVKYGNGIAIRLAQHLPMKTQTITGRLHGFLIKN